LAAGASQEPLEDIVCVWNMGAGYADITRDVAWLNSSVSDEMSFSYGQEADVGSHTVHVNCSNPVSSVNVSTEVIVVWDNVTLGELTCADSILWNHPMTCQFNIVRFGTGACFEWDMGDGRPVVYLQAGSCAGSVADASPTYIQVYTDAHTHTISLSLSLSLSLTHTHIRPPPPAVFSVQSPSLLCHVVCDSR